MRQRTTSPEKPVSAGRALMLQVGRGRAALRVPAVRRILAYALAIEAFLFALWAVMPLGGVSLSLSPLARAWPALLLPARFVFSDALAEGSVPPERELPALLLVGVLLVGASIAAVLAALTCREVAPRAAASRGALLGVLVVTLALGLTMVLLPTLPSDDVFSYILYSRISVVHGANPLIAVPSDFPKDPFLTLVFWRDVRSVYGSVWLLISGVVALLAEGFGGSLVAYVALFKLLGLAAHLANAALIWAILGRLAPRRQLIGTVLYAWSPLSLLEFCASGHNDAVMLTFLLLAVYCLVRGWVPAGMVAFGLSVATKYVPLILLPFYLVLVIRQQRARGTAWRAIVIALAWRLGIVLAVMIATTLPYWAGPSTLGALLFSPPAQQLNNSLLEAISWPLRWLAQGAGLAADTARNVVDTGLKLIALGAFAVLWLRELRRPTTLETMLAAWGWALVWYVLVASGWFWPWYVTWALAVVTLLPWRGLTSLTLWLAGGALTLYAFLPLHSAGIYGFRSVVAFAPAVVYLLALAWRRGGREALLRLSGDRRGARRNDLPETPKIGPRTP